MYGLSIKRGAVILASIMTAGVIMAKPFTKPSQAELARNLSSMQYKVTQKNGTEPPFQNEFWDNKEDGIYVDIVSGEPLFSSIDKFKSGTGWPSFTKPIAESNIVEKSDRSLFSVRTEVRSKAGDSHLGHVFDDGPAPTGKRYCINSASLKFVKAGDLEKAGYEEYAKQFAKMDAKLNATSKKTAIFAGGCFWCMEPPFEKMKGVSAVVSGYTGGTIKNPTYAQVSSGRTKHIESVRIEYDPSVVSYEQLLDVFWKNINPTDDGGQFVDRGYQYKSAIFVMNDEERKIATKSRDALAASGKFGDSKIVTNLIDATEFYDAEEYHQDYYKKNPIRYKFYRSRSGRDRFLKKTWKK